MNKRSTISTLAALALSTSMAIATPAQFDSPDAAVDALIAALQAGDKAAVLELFGPENEDVISTGDPAEDAATWLEFLDDVTTVKRIEMDTEDRATLYTGRDFWPFPAPLVLANGTWSFDADAAREEVRMRRIGNNELAVIDILRRAHDIQAAYRNVDHDGDGVLEFAASIISSPGTRDGLYWPEEPGAPLSPFDASIAQASFTGYSVNGEDHDPEPFEGYYFRILHGQGAAAPGGTYSYLINGNMVAGYAVVAYPAVYGDTGIMSFMVGEDGIVYESDLGEATLEIATEVKLYDPNSYWSVVEE